MLWLADLLVLTVQCIICFDQLLLETQRADWLVSWHGRVHHLRNLLLQLGLASISREELVTTHPAGSGLLE